MIYLSPVVIQSIQASSSRIVKALRPLCFCKTDAEVSWQSCWPRQPYSGERESYSMASDCQMFNTLLTTAWHVSIVFSIVSLSAAVSRIPSVSVEVYRQDYCHVDQRTELVNLLGSSQLRRIWHPTNNFSLFTLMCSTGWVIAILVHWLDSTYWSSNISKNVRQWLNLWKHHHLIKIITTKI